MIDLGVIILYFVGMLAIGWYAKATVRTEEDFAVAGRRLVPLLYGGTLAAVVLGGASTVGGIGLGYAYGLSGMWLVVSIGCGVILVSLVFAGRIRRMRLYTVGEMLELRYGSQARLMTGVVMAVYTLLLCVVSTIACGSVLSTVFGIDRFLAMAIGGGVVLFYSMLGGMWSITLTDIVQFAIKTVGIFFILVPLALYRVDGFDGLSRALPPSAFSLTHVGVDAIVAYFVTYVFGLVIGQDIWQRIATARTEGIARWAGTASGVYCLFYGAAGALIGMCAKVLLPAVASRDQVFSSMVIEVLPPGLSGLVTAAALAAIMSTASGALIACATVVSKDIMEMLLGFTRPDGGEGESEGRPPTDPHHDLKRSRLFLLCLGVVAILLAYVLDDVVAALTIAYCILVGGLLVAIIGAILWRRANIQGALASMIVGTGATIGAMILGGDIYASMPIFLGIGSSLATFVGVSLCFPPPLPARLAQWDARIASSHGA
ncbi:sodium:solute symporter [soil metagenome]